MNVDLADNITGLDIENVKLDNREDFKKILLHLYRMNILVMYMCTIIGVQQILY